MNTKNTKKAYKDRTVKLGYSDIAQLVLRDPNGVYELQMGEDGDYKAYIVENRTVKDIPIHYQPRITMRGWMWVYDDEGCVLRVHADYIQIYRAGNRGILINLIGDDTHVEEELR